MSIVRINFDKLPFLGVFALATDKMVVVPDRFSKVPEETVREALGVQMIRTNVNFSPLIGVLIAANSNGTILPDLPGIDEKKFEEELGMKATLIPSKYTALGNLILANDKGAIVNPSLQKTAIKVIEKTLDVPVERGTIAGLKNVGAAGIATNKGALLHPDVSREELEKVEEILEVPADIGTASGGVKYLGACIVANSNGALVGETTTGPELGRIESSLGFV